MFFFCGAAEFGVVSCSGAAGSAAGSLAEVGAAADSVSLVLAGAKILRVPVDL